MLIMYNGPREEIDLPPHGKHKRGEVKDYPEAYALDLLATSKRQLFAEIVIETKEKEEAAPPLVRRRRRGEKSHE